MPGWSYAVPVLPGVPQAIDPMGMLAGWNGVISRGKAQPEQEKAPMPSDTAGMGASLFLFFKRHRFVLQSPRFNKLIEKFLHVFRHLAPYCIPSPISVDCAFHSGNLPIR